MGELTAMLPHTLYDLMLNDGDGWWAMGLDAGQLVEQLDDLCLIPVYDGPRPTDISIIIDDVVEAHDGRVTIIPIEG